MRSSASQHHTNLRVLAASFAVAAALWGQGLSPNERLGDLQQLAGTLPQVHPNLFTVITREQFDAAVSQLASENPQITTLEFYTRLSALVALVGDSHTNLNLTWTAGRKLGFDRLPFQVRCFSDGVYVIAAPDEKPHLLGARVVSVNGVPIADVLVRLERVIAHENPYWLRFRIPDYLTNDGVLRGAGIVEAGQSALFGLELSSGESADVEFAPSYSTAVTGGLHVLGGHPPYNTLYPQLNYWSQYFEDSRTLYIRYRSCTEQTARPFAGFSDDTLRLIDKNTVETIVFDLRENGGGRSGLIGPLLTGLMERQPRLRENPAFRVYTIIDGGTFSSGEITAAGLTMPDRGELLAPSSLLVGEPTGGKPVHFGEVLSFTLSNSGLTVSHSSQRHPNQPWVPDLDALYPNVRLWQRSTDYFTRHDPWLALVLNRVPRLPEDLEGDVTVVNSASLRREQGLAPGSFATAFGDFPEGRLEVQVAGRSVEVTSATRTQFHFRMPLDIEPSTVSIEVRDAQGVTRTGRFEVSPAAPALFVVNNTDRIQPGEVLNDDGHLNGRDAPARKGSAIRIFGTGNASGARTSRSSAGAPRSRLCRPRPATPTVWISERKAHLVDSAMTAEGKWQITATIPEDSSVGVVPVYVAAGGLVSNAVTIIVE